MIHSTEKKIPSIYVSTEQLTGIGWNAECQRASLLFLRLVYSQVLAHTCKMLPDMCVKCKQLYLLIVNVWALLNHSFDEHFLKKGLWQIWVINYHFNLQTYINNVCSYLVTALCCEILHMTL